MNNIETLIAEYARYAAEHGSAIEEGDHQRANRAYDAVIDTYRQLRDVGADGMIALQNLMEHRNESVRCAAATHCLCVAEDKAMTVLRELSRGSGPVSLSAEMVLGEWQKGTLEIPT